MNFESKNAQAEVVFNNSPKYSEHLEDTKSNERRRSLLPEVKEYILNSERFKEKRVEVTFSEQGVSSLVSFLETLEEKLVLKIPLASKPREGEGGFLKVWENSGVAVPHVVEEGRFGESPFTLMEYVDAKSLTETSGYNEMVSKGVFVEMGQILRKMHEEKTEGFGRVIDMKPAFSEFRDWLMSKSLQKKVAYCQENKLLSDEHGDIALAHKILVEFVSGQRSSYCHNDFAAYNVFATEPLTIFDPDPTLNNGYLDIGKSIAIEVAHGGLPEAGEQLKSGYFGDQRYEKEVLQASVLFNSCMKIYTWHKHDYVESIKRLQDYLIHKRGDLKK